MGWVFILLLYCYYFLLVCVVLVCLDDSSCLFWFGLVGFVWCFGGCCYGFWFVLCILCLLAWWLGFGCCGVGLRFWARCLRWGGLWFGRFGCLCVAMGSGLFCAFFACLRGGGFGWVRWVSTNCDLVVGLTLLGLC